MTRASCAPLGVIVAFGLAGCSGPISVYHNVEGGAIAQPRQPPPGADLPYPNLASVPAVPPALTAGETLAVTERLSASPPPMPATEANPAALAGLDLPAAPPPAPDVPGLDLPSAPTPHRVVAPLPAAAAAPALANSAPVALAFRPGSAIVNANGVAALTAIAGSRGNAKILAGGFGDAESPGSAAITLALERAQAIADRLTAAGVPPAAIRLTAAAAGTGGFVQLVY